MDNEESLFATEPLTARQAEDELKQLQREIRHKAVDLLSRREHTRHELVQKLLKRDYQRDLIEPILDQLVERDYLSDERFAHQFAEQHIAKGFGEYGVLVRLAQRGVDSTLAKRAVVAQQADWFEQAQIILRKRYAKVDIIARGRGVNEAERVEAERQRNKQARFLKSRGFSTEQIMVALDSDAPE